MCSSQARMGMEAPLVRMGMEAPLVRMGMEAPLVSFLDGLS